MSRLEFVSLATQPGSNLRQLCRNFGISPTTSYKWIMRYERGDAAELRDRCRRPRNSPNRASAAYCRGSKLRVGLWREESGCVTRGAVGVAWIFSQFLPNWMRAEFLPACKVAFDVRSTRDVAQVWQVWPRERLSEHNRIDADLLHYFDLAGVEHVHLGKSSLFTVTLVIAHFENAGRDSFFRKSRNIETGHAGKRTHQPAVDPLERGSRLRNLQVIGPGFQHRRIRVERGRYFHVGIK